MKSLIMAALAVVCLATPAMADASQHVSWGTKNGSSGNAPLDDHTRLTGIAGAANDAANLGKTTYNTISNYTCGTCININTDGNGNVITTTGTTTGPVTGVQAVGSDSIQQIIQP
jgi:hypothetical protein